MSRPENRDAQNAWSRRRAAVQAEAEAERADERAEARAEARAEHQAEQAGKSDAQILTELDLKDPDQLQAGDDFAAFLRDEVPAHLQRRALRILWRSNPVLACVDNLVDYGNDFRAEALGAGVVQTAYRVGKGMLAHVQEMEKQAAEDGPAALDDPKKPEADAEASTAPAVASDEPVPAPNDAGFAEVSPATLPEDPDPAPLEEQPKYLHRRRMRFEFEGVA